MAGYLLTTGTTREGEIIGKISTNYGRTREGEVIGRVFTNYGRTREGEVIGRVSTQGLGREEVDACCVEVGQHGLEQGRPRISHHWVIVTWTRHGKHITQSVGLTCTW